MACIRRSECGLAVCHAMPGSNLAAGLDLDQDRQEQVADIHAWMHNALVAAIAYVTLTSVSM